MLRVYTYNEVLHWDKYLLLRYFNPEFLDANIYVMLFFTSTKAVFLFFK